MLRFSTLVADVYRDAEQFDIDTFRHVLLARILTCFNVERVLLVVGDRISASHGDLVIMQANKDEWIRAPAGGQTSTLWSKAVRQNLFDRWAISAATGREDECGRIGLGTHYAFDDAPGLAHALVAGEFDTHGGGRLLLMYKHRRPTGELDTSELLQALWPHLSLAISRNLQQALYRTDTLKAKRSLALIQVSGLIETADPEFTTLFQSEWPTGHSDRMPGLAMKSLVEHGVYQGSLIKITARAAGGKLVCRAVSVSVLHRLGEIERKIALRLVDGLGYREISEQLGTSPNTVRNQIAAIYRKLNINSKVSLVTMLAGHMDDNGLRHHLDQSHPL